MRKHSQEMMVCLDNDGYEASLEKRKLYIALVDNDAAKHNLVRIIDESGEDYLYPASFFSMIELPPGLRRAVMLAA